MDFALLHGQMPSFHLQQPSPVFPPDNQNLFQPLPQHPNQHPMGRNLQIDTSSGYGMDFRQFPMSATATSPSEYASPGFFPAHPAQQGTPMAAADFNTPYSMPFLSPSPMVDPSNMIQPSASPLSQMSHADPVIADHSPPMNGMHRSASADFFNHPNENNGFSEEQLMLSDMYSKQNLNLSMPSPGIDENGLMAMHDMEQQFHTPREHMDMPLTPFGTIDPNSLGMSQNH
jgi:hypothetical protein